MVTMVMRTEERLRKALHSLRCDIVTENQIYVVCMT